MAEPDRRFRRKRDTGQTSFIPLIALRRGPAPTHQAPTQAIHGYGDRSMKGRVADRLIGGSTRHPATGRRQDE